MKSFIGSFRFGRNYTIMDYSVLKKLLLEGDPEFWDLLASLTREAQDFDELFLLSSLRKKAHVRRVASPWINSENGYRL